MKVFKCNGTADLIFYFLDKKVITKNEKAFLIKTLNYIYNNNKYNYKEIYSYLNNGFILIEAWLFDFIDNIFYYDIDILIKEKILNEKMEA